MTDVTPAGWEGILAPGEAILWQGRPDTRITMRAQNWATLVFGLFFAGFAAIWMLIAAAAGGFFWMFGLLHFSVGLGVAFLPPYLSAWRRRHTWYTLTDRRAFIATDLPMRGRSLDAYPITAQTPVSLIDRDPATIIFAKKVGRGKRGTYDIPVGFENIHDGRAVMALIHGLQRSDRA